MGKLEFLQLIDLFGINIQLFMKGQQSYKTTFGALMTLSLCSILAYSCNSFIMEMNKGKNAILNYKESMLPNNEGFEFDSTNFDFVVGLVDQGGMPIPNPDERRIFDVVFYYCNKTSENVYCDWIPAVICGERFRKASQQLDVPDHYLNITYCISEDYLQNKSKIRFQNSERKDNFTSFGVILSKCQNRTYFKSICLKYQACAPEEEIISYTHKANLYFSYPSFEFNKEIDGSPYVQVQNLEILQVHKNVKKMIKVYLQSSVSELEFNPFYWFPSNVTYKSVEYEKSYVDIFLNYDDEQDNLAQIEIMLGAKEKHYFITYQTLMDVIAKTAGFFAILKMVFSVVLYPVQNMLYRISLVNFLSQTGSQTANDHQPISRSTSFGKLIFSNQSRETCKQQLKVIDKLLDVREILINPLRLVKQMEDLQGSIKRFDASGGGICKQPDINMFDEIPNNNQIECLKSISERAIDQEIRIGSYTSIQLPRFQVR